MAPGRDAAGAAMPNGRKPPIGERLGCARRDATVAAARSVHKHCRRESIYWQTGAAPTRCCCSTENGFSRKEDFSLYDLETSYA
jgi:hypothetical protein